MIDSKNYASNLPHETLSVCPECKQVLNARVFEDSGKVFIERDCPIHGNFKEVYWESAEYYNKMRKFACGEKHVQNPNTGLAGEDGTSCPFDCGLCSNHKSHTGLANIALTNRCDLSCWYCFYFAKEGEPIYEPSLELIDKMLANLRKEAPISPNAVQLSLDFEEKILLKNENGLIQYLKIGEFAEKKFSTGTPEIAKEPIVHERIKCEGFEVLTIDESLKACFKPISQIIRHKTSEDLFKIETENGWVIKTTGSHSVFTINANGELQAKPVKTLKIGEIIPGCLKIPETVPIERINLIDTFKKIGIDESKIMICGFAKENLEKIRKETGKAQNWDSLRLSDFEKCGTKEATGLRYFNSKKEKELPIILEFTPELFRLLGYYAGEGCCYKNGVIFTFNLHETEIINDFIECVKAIFGNTNYRKIERFGSALQIYIEGYLYKLFFESLGCGKRALSKKIPEIVFNANRELKKQFLKAYFECDGNIRDRKSGFEIVFNTASKELAKDIVLLNNQLGAITQINTSTTKEHFVSKINRKIKGGSLKFALSVTGKEQLQKFKWILEKDKLKKLERYCSKEEKHSSNYLRIPIFDDIKRMTAAKNITEIQRILKGIKFDKSISKEKLAKITECFKSNGLPFNINFNDLSHSDIGFFKIREIKRIKPSAKFVYDISVPGNQAFFAGLGQLLAHNTGGEPTLREDLVEIIKLCKKHGFEQIQLNTTGMSLGFKKGLAEKVAKAGVSTIYLSFDGVSKKANPKNHWEIPYTLQECQKAGIGAVLVPTLIKGINDQEIGEIINFGLNNIKTVRGVNFQPVSFVGRISKKDRDAQRITIPKALELIEEQTNGAIAVKDFYTVPSIHSITRFVEVFTGQKQYDLSVHFACGAATYVFLDGKKVIPITRFVDVEGLFEFLDSQSQELEKGALKPIVAGKMLLKAGQFIDKSKEPSYLKLEKILVDVLVKHNFNALAKIHENSMLIGMMHFMDPYNYDLERVQRCDIHYAMPDGRIIPFCSFNVLPEIYRDKVQKQYSIPWQEWSKQNKGLDPNAKYKRNVQELEGSETYKKYYPVRKNYFE